MGERIAFSSNGGGTIRQTYAKRIKKLSLINSTISNNESISQTKSKRQNYKTPKKKIEENLVKLAKVS